MCQSKDKRPRALSPRAADRQKETEKQQQRLPNGSTGKKKLPFYQYLFALSVEDDFFFGGGEGGLRVKSFNGCAVSRSFYGG